jgi:hypothetical protein
MCLINTGNEERCGLGSDPRRTFVSTVINLRPSQKRRGATFLELAECVLTSKGGLLLLHVTYIENIQSSAANVDNPVALPNKIHSNN